MSKKHFSWLLIVTIVVTGLVLLIPLKTGKESSFERRGLLPGLAAVVNELDYVRLTAGGGEVIATLELDDGFWRVLEASSYAADWATLRALLFDLSRAEVIEEKTSNPEFYSRLGVEDVSQDGASGLLIEFAPDSGIPKLILGKQATGREGQYVRIQSEGRSALIGRKLDVPRDRLQWLNRDIIDIADSETVEVTITHPDGESLSVSKTSTDDSDFQLQDIPKGRELKSSWTANALGGSLSSLRLEDVMPAVDIDWSGAIALSLLTADGLRVNADLVVREESYWIRLVSEAYASAAQNLEQEAEASPEMVVDLTGRVSEINDRVSGWAYRIPQYKYDAMSKRMDDMLQAEEAP
jgi:hypothetical protein